MGRPVVSVTARRVALNWAGGLQAAVEAVDWIYVESREAVDRVFAGRYELDHVPITARNTIRERISVGTDLCARTGRRSGNYRS